MGFRLRVIDSVFEKQIDCRPYYVDLISLTLTFCYLYHSYTFLHIFFTINRKCARIFILCPKHNNTQSLVLVSLAFCLNEVLEELHWYLLVFIMWLMADTRITLNIWCLLQCFLWRWFLTTATEDHHLSSLKDVEWLIVLCAVGTSLSHLLCVRLASRSSPCHIGSLFGSTMRFVFLTLNDTAKVYLNMWIQVIMVLDFLVYIPIYTYSLKEKGDLVL